MQAHSDPTISEAARLLVSGPSSTPHLHGYSSKTDDKTGVAIQDQLIRIREIKTALVEARTLLAQREGDWGKLSRGLREISNHQQVLLPLPDLLPAPPSSSSSRHASRSSPTKLVALSPSDLLTTLARQCDIQVYAEDSQFGLLKQTLALAGNCFVIDVELETDPVPEEGATPQVGAESEAEEGSKGVAGRVRLSSIAVNHVPPGGGHEASPHVKGVLQQLVMAYLEATYAKAEGYVQGREKSKRVQKTIDALKDALRCVKELDGRGEGSGSDSAGLFASLERIAKRADQWGKSKRVFAEAGSSIFPAFRLIDTARRGDSFQVRPVRSADLPPALPISKPQDEDMSSTKTETDAAVIEYLPGAVYDGLPVRRSWLDASLSDGSKYNGGVKIENLIYKSADVQPSSFSTFPYSTEFTPTSSADQDKLQQKWSIASPGPDGFVVGRIPLPFSETAADSILSGLRRQIIANELFTQIFSPSNIHSATDGQNEGVDEELDDLLGEIKAIPVDVSLSGSSIIARYPFAESAHHLTVQLRTTPADEPKYVNVQVNVERSMLGTTGDQALVDVVRERISQAVQEKLGAELAGTVPKLSQLVDIAYAATRQ